MGEILEYIGWLILPSIIAIIIFLICCMGKGLSVSLKRARDKLEAFTELCHYRKVKNNIVRQLLIFLTQMAILFIPAIIFIICTN